MKRLAVVTTHPIQYYAPLFRLLTERGKIKCKVFYTWEREATAYDVDFGRVIEWDIPLLDGYEYEFISNQGDLRRNFFGVRNPDLINKIEHWEPDAVLVFGWNYYSHLKVLRHFKNKIPVFFRGDSTLLNEKPGIKVFARRMFLRWIYSHVNTAFYVGKHNKDYFIAHGLHNNQLVFAPHAIDNDRFADPGGQYAREAMHWRKELGIKESDIVLLFAAKFQELKCAGLLIKAFLSCNESALHLVLAGNGEQEEYLKQLSANHPNIHFLPFQNQSRMPVLYKLGDIFCLPSHSETWGLAINEAMACGKAVIASDRCGCASDLVQNGKNGFIFEHNNEFDLAEKIRYFLSHSKDIERMGAASLEIIRDWSFQSIVAAIESTTQTH